MILPLFLIFFLAKFTHADDMSPGCHDKKIHDFPITLKELHSKWYLIGSAFDVKSSYEYDKKSVYGLLDIQVIEGKTTFTYWNGLIGNIAVIFNENASFVEHDDHVMLEDPQDNYRSKMYKHSDNCIEVTTYNYTDLSHEYGHFIFCRSFRVDDSVIEAFKQRSLCWNYNYTLVRQYDFEYATKCHSVARHLDPLDVKSILGIWHMVAKAGKDDRMLETEHDRSVEFIMDGETLKMQEGHGSIKLSQNEATVNKSKILVKHGNTSCVLTFYPTCKDCLLMRHEDGSDGNVKLYLFRRSGKLTAEEVETFKDNVRCLSLPMATVLQDTHTPEQKEEKEKSQSK